MADSITEQLFTARQLYASTIVKTALKTPLRCK